MILLSELATKVSVAAPEANISLCSPRTDPNLAHAHFDSREIGQGSLFVALVGQRVDGHDFIPRAVSAGASAVLIQRDHLDTHTPSIPYIVCEDTRAVLGVLSAILYGSPLDAMDVIGITGTNGKTTTSYLLEAMLDAAGRSPGVIGTVNYRWSDTVLDAPNTTPESLIIQRLAAQMREDDVDALVMEVSSHGLATHRLEAVRFDVAIWTNFSQDHLDFHGTMEAYQEAKERLFFELLADDGVAILNIDDEVGENIAARLERARPSIKIMTYSLRGGAGAKSGVLSWRETLEGIVFTASDSSELRSPMLGAFNVSNALAARLATKALKTTGDDVIQEGLSRMGGVPGRLERVNPGQRPAVFVDYAHTPDALERALIALRPHCEGALRVLFGCGGDRDRSKRALMGEVAARLADAIVITSDNPRKEPPEVIIDAILEGIPDEERGATERLTSRGRAIEAVIMGAASEDVILIAGKGHETYQELATGRIDFDDRAHARANLRRRGGFSEHLP